MILLDTDIFSLLSVNQPKIVHRMASVKEPIAITIITWIEVLRGRFDFLLKAVDAKQLESAQYWLDRSRHELSNFLVMPITPQSALTLSNSRARKVRKECAKSDALISSLRRLLWRQMQRW